MLAFAFAKSLGAALEQCDGIGLALADQRVIGKLVGLAALRRATAALRAWVGRGAHGWLGGASCH